MPNYPLLPYGRGFGAKYGGVVRHCFQCGSKDEVDGVDGILHAYHEAFKSGLVMSGPTDFSEVIMTAGALASSRQVRIWRTIVNNHLYRFSLITHYLSVMS
jgi:hypothetical protein